MNDDRNAEVERLREINRELVDTHNVYLCHVAKVERALADERAKVARVEEALRDFRNHADWCQAVGHAGCCQGECDCHVATFRAALDGTR